MMKRLMACGLLLSALTCLTTVSAQEAPVDFEAFRALQGWTFSADLSKAEGLPDLDGALSTAEGGVPLDASTFDPTSFDARMYQIALSENPARPTNFRVGNQGVIQFHSADRCRELHARHRINTAKQQ